MRRVHLQRYAKRQSRGASALSYGLVVGLISVVALGAVTSIGSQNDQLFTTVGITLQDVTETTSGAAAAEPTADNAQFTSFSCLSIKQDNPSASDGSYSIDPDGPSGGDPAFNVWCDMTTDGGGWTLISAYSGAPDGNVYANTAGFNTAALTSASTAANAKLPDDAILDLIDGRRTATMRSVSASYDTLVERTDGGNVFDDVAPGMTFQCKQVSASSWVSYQDETSGCGLWGDFPGLRVTTWTQGCNYVGYNNVPSGNPCGAGQSFSSGFSANHEGRQWNDAGFTASAAVPGLWFVR